MFMGLGIGAMVMVSQFYGAGDAERLKATIDTIYTALIVGIVPLSIVGILVSRPIIAALLAVPADTADQCWIYMVIVLGGLIGSLGYNANSGILQGLGDSKNAAAVPCHSVHHQHRTGPSVRGGIPLGG